LLFVVGDAGVEYRIELVAIGSGKIQSNQTIDVFRCIDLISVERRLQVVELIRIGLFTLKRFCSYRSLAFRLSGDGVP
jgi:hypothetical protein